jgi:hypothetical protein
MLSIILQTVNENWNLIWGIDSPNWDMHESGKGNCLVVRGGTWYRKLKTIGSMECFLVGHCMLPHDNRNGVQLNFMGTLNWLKRQCF